MNIPVTRSAPRSISRSLRPALMLYAVLFLLAFAFQGSRPLYDSDEGRYSAIALGMLDSGDFIVPHLDPDHPHYAKPPLTYWVLAASFATFGPNAWAARIPGALAYAGVGSLLAWMGRRLQLQNPWRAGTLWAITLAPFIGANVVTTDMLLTFFEALAVAGFVAAETAARPTDAARWRIMMWCAFGLAFMTKGPPALVPLPALAVTLVSMRGWRGLRRLLSLPGMVLGAVLGLSWYAYVVARQPGLLGYFVGYELVDRLLTNTQHRNPGLEGVLMTYLPTLVVGTLPWSALLLNPRIRALRPARRLPRVELGWRLAVCWCAIGAAIFLLAQSRLPLYVLPLFVPFSLWLAMRLDTIADLLRGRGAPLLVAWVALLLGIKLISARIPTGHDGRAFAAQLERLVEPREVSEWIFVDGEPRYELRLYTGRIVAIASSELAEPAFSHPEPLCLAVAEPAHPVVLTKTAEAARLAPVLDGCAHPFDVAGQAGAYTVFVPRQ
jgi:4-amino-4-deoxy-L-arabinose transferase